MTRSIDRRRFLGSAIAMGAAIGGSFLPAARATTTGRALIGFQVPGPATTLIELVLAGLRGRYQPDLGLKPVVIPGASGALALDAVLKAPPDGGTVLILPSSVLTLLPLSRNAPDEAANQLLPVAGIGELCLAFVVGPAVPASVRTISDYVEWVRANPQFSSYGVPGMGTAPYLVGKEMSHAAGLPLKAVTYKGMQGLAADVTSGAVAAGVIVVPETAYAANAPGLRLLAVTSSQRLTAFPEVPTMIEAGLMQAPAIESLGFFFAAGTPTSKVDELATAIRAVAATPVLQSFMADINMHSMPAASYVTVLADERTTWLALAKRVDQVR